MTEKRKYRVFTPEQKLAIVLAGMRGHRQVKEVCRQHQISDALFYPWPDPLLQATRQPFSRGPRLPYATHAPPPPALRRHVPQARHP